MRIGDPPGNGVGWHYTTRATPDKENRHDGDGENEQARDGAHGKHLRYRRQLPAGFVASIATFALVETRTDAQARGVPKPGSDL